MHDEIDDDEYDAESFGIEDEDEEYSEEEYSDDEYGDEDEDDAFDSSEDEENFEEEYLEDEEEDDAFDSDEEYSEEDYNEYEDENDALDSDEEDLEEDAFDSTDEDENYPEEDEFESFDENSDEEYSEDISDFTDEDDQASEGYDYSNENDEYFDEDDISAVDDESEEFVTISEDADYSEDDDYASAFEDESIEDSDSNEDAFVSADSLNEYSSEEETFNEKNDIFDDGTFDFTDEEIVKEDSEISDEAVYNEGEDESEVIEDYEEPDESETESVEPIQGGVSAMSDTMRAEYDRIFSDEEKVSHLLKVSSDKFSISFKNITITQIGITQPSKMGRQQTVSGLTQSIRDLGVVTPIHVMAVAEEDASDDYRYVLIDGMRRIFGAIKNNLTEIPAVVWEFNDIDLGMDLILPLSLMLNRQQRRQWKETWDLYRVLEMQSSITPATLEYLLQLEAGDAMKLKDVMLCNYSEVIDALLNGDKDLEGCYKMLQKLRKEEDQLSKDDATGFSDTVDSAEEISSESNSEGGQLSDQDVMELLEMAGNMDDEEVGEDDFNDMATPDADFVDQQKVGERHPLDPALRQAVLARDDFTCHCCGMRMVGARLGLIAVHHILPVHVGGKDTLDNLTTLCLNCHVSLHIMERNGGTIMMAKEDFDALPEAEQSSLKKSLHLARTAIEADKRRGMSKQQIEDATKDSIRHPMPGSGMKENQQAYSRTKSQSEE